MLVSYPSRAQTLIYAVLFSLLLLATRSWRGGSSRELAWSGFGSSLSADDNEDGSATPPPTQYGDENLPCRNLPGAEDVVVVMRTGATEIQDKLPRHFETTFRCYSDLIIFSDFEETFMGHPVHDVLKNVDEEVLESNEDFEIYLRLRANGRVSLQADELSGKLSFEGSKSGKLENAGWRLDKWKFLPMMREVLNLRPDKKWYLFLESDSYVVWSNLLKYLEQLDPTQDIYYGSEVQIGEDLFAHGGSAFIMTSSAIRKGAETYEADPDKWHSWTARHWAGDCVLGRCLLKGGVPLGWAWPMFQGGHPEKMDWTEWKADVRVWCSPLLSFHHFADVELQRIWQFEQDWITMLQNTTRRMPGVGPWSMWGGDRRDDDILYGSDVFKSFVLPQITTSRRSWTNLSPNVVDDAENTSFEVCRKHCKEDSSCVQYLYEDNKCFTGPKPMVGQPSPGTGQSDWLEVRVDKFMKRMDQCEQWAPGWTLT